MIRIVIVGICGQMGQALCRSAAELQEMTIVAGVDRLADAAFPYPIYPTLQDVQEAFDVVIDFSVPAALEQELSYITQAHKPLVVGTTGLTDDHLVLLQAAAKQAAIFQSGNMSVGVNLQMHLLHQAAKSLGSSFDVEIVERHHRKKVDAPSGTALMLAEAVSAEMISAPDYIFGRREKNQRRTDHEIGFHSVRGGTIVGEHEVSFIGQDEVIEITHKAFSKRIFAEGALRAAQYLIGKPYGFYHMSDLLSGDPASTLIAEQPSVILSLSVPAEQSQVLTAACEALSRHNIGCDLLCCAPSTNEFIGIGLIVPAADLCNAIEALQPLQVEHDFFDVQMQGGTTLLTVTNKDANSVSLLPLLAKHHVFPLLLTATHDGFQICIKNSEKSAALECLKPLVY